MSSANGMCLAVGEEGALFRAANEPSIALTFKEQARGSLGKLWSALKRDPVDHLAFAGASTGESRTIRQVSRSLAEKGRTTAKAERVNSGAGIRRINKIEYGEQFTHKFGLDRRRAHLPK